MIADYMRCDKKMRHEPALPNMGSCELPAFTRLPLGGQFLAERLNGFAVQEKQRGGQDAGAAAIHEALRERVHGGGGSRGEGNCKKGANGSEMGRYTAVAAFVVKNALRLQSRIMSAQCIRNAVDTGNYVVRKLAAAYYAVSFSRI